MKVAYYPGCSNHATAVHYEESTRRIAPILGLELLEIEDWNCCGATSYMSVNEILSFCLTARNLALAKPMNLPVVTTCSACYTNLKKTDIYLAEFPQLKEKVSLALAEAGLSYEGGVVSKHLLQVIMEDIGLEKVKSLVKKPLKNLRVAPYYGCQIVRPYGIEDNPDDPQMLDRLLSTIGAIPAYYPMKTLCCGGSLMGTREEVALRLVRNLLLCAQQNGADCITVLCPLCQTNLDLYQKRINRIYNTDFAIPIIYFTQLLGLAFDLDVESLGFSRCIVSPANVFSKLA